MLSQIPSDELSSYVVSIRTGVLYFFSKRFRFNRSYSVEDIPDILQRKISISNDQYYFPRTNNSIQIDDGLRSAFCNVKPVNQSRKFVDELEKHQFYVKEQKHVYRIYLQSEDKQTHVCIIDPALNYSIIEFSKDFQRTSNIGKLNLRVSVSSYCFSFCLDYIRDRSSSKFGRNKTYDDIFDFRIQFQYNPRTCSDQLNTIEYELHQQFPSLEQNFRNENILIPLENDENEFQISEQLCPYITFIRRDFGDVYQYKGDDTLFENFTIYLESSVEYYIDRKQSICKPNLDTHGLVYARLDLNTMISSNTIDENLLISKLWDMGTGLTSIAGECTTSETQQSTNYYTPNGDMYTAEDEALIQRILKQQNLRSMLGLPHYAPSNQVKHAFDQIMNQLESKWHCLRFGANAHDKLNASYDEFIQSTVPN